MDYLDKKDVNLDWQVPLMLYQKLSRLQRVGSVRFHVMPGC